MLFIPERAIRASNEMETIATRVTIDARNGSTLEVRPHAVMDGILGMHEAIFASRTRDLVDDPIRLNEQAIHTALIRA